jgi:serine/threonine-protein kinase
MINRILKGYQIVDRIADGSVGTVWRAINSRNETFALKQLSEKASKRPEKVRQFRDEAILTKKMHHAHIIRVFEYVDIPPQPFFTMEFFPSENLKFATWNQADRVWRKEFYILRQLAEALAHIHSLGVIHKDLKPENVLIDKKSRVRLIDFSLSKTKWQRKLQFKKIVEGTPLYMAPEQIRGEKCDVRTDIYSFGVLMYELLTKRPPFLGTTQQHLLQKHLKEPPLPMRTFVKTISQDLDAFMKKLLSKNPDDRFPTMISIIHELSKWERKDTVIRIRQVEPVKKKGQ